MVGEEARDNFRVNSANCVCDFPRLLGRTPEDYVAAVGAQPRFRLVAAPEGSGGTAAAVVQYNGQDVTVLAEHAQGMVLRALHGFAKRALPSPDAAVRYAVAVPPSMSPAARQAMRDAAAIAQLPGEVALVESQLACAAVYAGKHHSTLPGAGEAPRFVGIVDVGAGATTVAVFAFTKGETKQLAVTGDGNLGGQSLDERLFEHCVKVCAERHGLELKASSKAGLRALAACQRTKKVLSTVADAKIDIENVAPDRDVSIEISQDELRRLAAPELERLKRLCADALMEAATADARLEALHSVELVGGGSRVPMVKEVISEVMGESLSYTLDSSHAVAMGAATVIARAEAVRAATEKREQAERAATAAAAAAAEAASALAAQEAEVVATAAAKEQEKEAGESSADAAAAAADDAGDAAATEATADDKPAEAPAAAARTAVDPAVRRASEMAASAASRAEAELASAVTDLEDATAAATGLVNGIDTGDAGSADAGGLSEAAILEARKLESTMEAQTAALAATSSALYEAQSYVNELRAAADGDDGAHLRDNGAVEVLDEAASWLSAGADRVADAEWSDASGEELVANLHTLAEEFKAKRAEVERTLRASCAAYFEAVDARRAKMEAELAAEQATREAEEEAEAAAGNADDHDRRKLKTSERLRIMLKQKEEGNELFRDGNFQAAAVRYVKAINHAAKFTDIGPEDKEAVDAAKLSSHLNLAQCYIKLERWQQALENCKSALFISPTSAKAAYRAGLAAEKLKDFGAAESYVQTAKAAAPEDKGVLKLERRLEKLRLRQKAKEKAMAKKMFG